MYIIPYGKQKSKFYGKQPNCFMEDIDKSTKIRYTIRTKQRCFAAPHSGGTL